MKTSFTHHAFSRVLDRLSLSLFELANILNYDLAVDIGTESGTNRIHRLFYSCPDHACFVAIQDSKSGVVVTVLPIDYHENISWSISQDSQIQAKNLLGANNFEEISNLPVIQTTATTFKITGYVEDEFGKLLKILSLGSWPCEPYEYRIENLIEDGDFLEELNMRIEKKMKREGYNPNLLQTVYVKLGNKGDPVLISLGKSIS
jgi:TATA-box binding protein (TBP) (component of TFIID and TFIIIB)